MYLAPFREHVTNAISTRRRVVYNGSEYPLFPILPCLPTNPVPGLKVKSCSLFVLFLLRSWWAAWVG
jgi:hypothetical protein